MNKNALGTTLIVLALMCGSATVFADDQPNIGGTGRRLERIDCIGGYSMEDHQGSSTKTVNDKCNGVPGSWDGLASCAKILLQSIGQYHPNTRLSVLADSGAKTFQVTIMDGQSQILKSLRTGEDGQGSDHATVLDFMRVGFENNDDYMIEVNSSDGLTAKFASVPVHRRLATDLVYFFVDGCALIWSK